MRLTLVIAFILIVPAAGVSGWWDAKVDTVEVHYADSGLKEQYQTAYSFGNEITFRHGFYRSWYANGRMEREGHYELGLRCGVWILWDSTGNRVEEVNFADNLEHGSAIEWNANGTVKKKLNYRNGELHGLCSWMKDDYAVVDFFNNPNLTLEREVFYLDGKELVTLKEKGSKEYESSCSDHKSPYYNPDLDLWVEWKMKGCCFFVGHKVDGRKNGMWVLWTKTGEMKKAEFYDMGVVRNE